LTEEKQTPKSHSTHPRDFTLVIFNPDKSENEVVDQKKERRGKIRFF